MKDNRSLEQKIRQVVYEAQQNRNTEARKKVANVGRPEGESKLAKQGEIKTKIIDEAGPETQPKEPKDEIKDKKPTKDKDTVDAKQITGGKTEVDLNPTTDDRTEEGKKIDDKAKKTTKQANREAGIQEGSNNMFKSDKTFGLPSDLINVVKEAMGKCSKCGKSPCQCAGDPKVAKEELVGGQKKLDKNHNGKLDKQDFKMLRKEEVEAIDEVSLKTKINAYKAAKDPEADYSYGSKVHDQADRIHKNIVAKHGAKAGEHADRAAYGKPSTPASRSAEKAKPDVLKRDTTHPMRTTKSGVAHKQDQKSNAAVIKSRLGKHGKSNIPEEVQFSEAEIARIESILKDL